MRRSKCFQIYFGSILASFCLLQPCSAVAVTAAPRLASAVSAPSALTSIAAPVSLSAPTPMLAPASISTSALISVQATPKTPTIAPAPNSAPVLAPATAPVAAPKPIQTSPNAVLSQTPPILVSGIPTNITQTSALMNGTVVSSSIFPVAPTFTFSGGSIGQISSSSITTSNSNFSANLTALECGTTYTFTARGTNKAGVGTAIKSQSFKTLPCPTVVTINAATAITTTTAVLSGSINSSYFPFVPGFNVSGGTVGAISTTSPSVTSLNFSTKLNNLECGTNYSFTAYGTNSAGAKFTSSTLNFTTSNCLAATISFTDAISISENSAVINGNVSSLGSWNSVVPTLTGPSQNYYASPSEIKNTGPFSISLTGLICNTDYAFSAYGQGNGITTAKRSLSFKTAACRMVVSENTATAITQTTAIINGTIVSSSIYPVIGSFTVSGGTIEAVSPSSITSANSNFSANLTNLTCGTYYTFTAQGASPGGTGSANSTQSFKTVDCLIKITSNPATLITATSASISGTIVSASNFPVTPGFTVSDGIMGAINPYSVSTSNSSFSVNLSGLACATLYTYTPYGTNSVGAKFQGPTQSFTTADCPAQ